MRIPVLIILCLLAACAQQNEGLESNAEKDTLATKQFGTEDYEYRTYYMGFLKRGEQRDQDSAEVMRLQKEHLAYMSKLADEGKLAIAGPFMDDGDTRGIVIYSVDSLKDARALAMGDPAVQAGRLSVEIRPWMSARGSKLP